MTQFFPPFLILKNYVCAHTGNQKVHGNLFYRRLPCTFWYNSCSVARISLNRYRAGAWRGERGEDRRLLP